MSGNYYHISYKFVSVIASLAILLSSVGVWACPCDPSCHHSKTNITEKQPVSPDVHHSCCSSAEQQKTSEEPTEQCKTCDGSTDECSCVAKIQTDLPSLPSNFLSLVESFNHLKTPDCFSYPLIIDSYISHQKQPELIHSFHPKSQTKAALYLFLCVYLI